MRAFFEAFVKGLGGFSLEVNMKIIRLGGGDRVTNCIVALDEWLIGKDETDDALIVLPIPTTRDKIRITDTELTLTELIDLAGPNVKIAGYGIPDHIKDGLEAKGAKVYDAALDEGFLVENARITAHGALGRILTETGRDLTELSIGIIGYGRIGSTLYELLMFLGARVKIYSTSDEKIIRLAMSGAEALGVDKIENFSGLDILINTAPKKLFSLNEEQRILSSGTKIIDLASGRSFASEMVVVMASIPDKMYPLSAGRLYAKHIVKALF